MGKNSECWYCRGPSYGKYCSPRCEYEHNRAIKEEIAEERQAQEINERADDAAQRYWQLLEKMMQQYPNFPLDSPHEVALSIVDKPKAFSEYFLIKVLSAYSGEVLRMRVDLLATHLRNCITWTQQAQLFEGRRIELLQTLTAGLQVVLSEPARRAKLEADQSYSNAKSRASALGGLSGVALGPIIGYYLGSSGLRQFGYVLLGLLLGPLAFSLLPGVFYVLGSQRRVQACGIYAFALPVITLLVVVFISIS